MATHNVTQPFCIWTPDDDGVYATSCGQEFVFIDSGPVENKMQFCCYCGKPLKAAPVDRVSHPSPARREA